jgi:hypothetical protein
MIKLQHLRDVRVCACGRSEFALKWPLDFRTRLLPYRSLMRALTDTEKAESQL